MRGNEDLRLRFVMLKYENWIKIKLKIEKKNLKKFSFSLSESSCFSLSFAWFGWSLLFSDESRCGQYSFHGRHCFHRNGCLTLLSLYERAIIGAAQRRRIKAEVTGSQIFIAKLRSTMGLLRLLWITICVYFVYLVPKVKERLAYSYA